MKRAAPTAASAGCPGNYHDFDREHCVDLIQLDAFLHATQPKAAESLHLAEDSPIRKQFLKRLSDQIDKRGTIDVLRNGIKHRALNLDLFYVTPSPDNEAAKERFALNRFTVTRQLRYSGDETQRSLDIALFINGLPVFTLELKKQPHRPDGRSCHRAVPDRPQPARKAVRLRAVRRPLRGG